MLKTAGHALKNLSPTVKSIIGLTLLFFILKTLARH